MATHSCILAWRIPWTEEPGGLQSWGCKESDMTEQLNNKKTSDRCIRPMDDPDAECLGSLVGEEIGSPGERFQGVCAFMFTEVKWKE